MWHASGTHMFMIFFYLVTWECTSHIALHEIKDLSIKLRQILFENIKSKSEICQNLFNFLCYNQCCQLM